MIRIFRSWTGALVVLLALTSVLSKEEPTASASASELNEMKVFRVGEIKWEKGPPSLPSGAEMAVLEGDPSKPGPFVFRVKLPDGYTIPPHTHPKAERLSVIAGTFHLGMGTTIDKAKGQTLPAGAFGYWPAGMNHYAWVAGETIVQLHGVGPWQIHYLNPADDPRNEKRP